MKGILLNDYFQWISFNYKKNVKIIKIIKKWEPYPNCETNERSDYEECVTLC